MFSNKNKTNILEEFRLSKEEIKAKNYENAEQTSIIEDLIQNKSLKEESKFVIFEKIVVENKKLKLSSIYLKKEELVWKIFLIL